MTPCEQKVIEASLSIHTTYLEYVAKGEAPPGDVVLDLVQCLKEANKALFEERSTQAKCTACTGD